MRSYDTDREDVVAEFRSPSRVRGRCPDCRTRLGWGDCPSCDEARARDDAMRNGDTDDQTEE